MAIARQTPTCPYCGEIIAKGVYKDQSQIPPMQRLIGDTFIRWDYIEHTCEGKEKAIKRLKAEPTEVPFDKLPKHLQELFEPVASAREQFKKFSLLKDVDSVTSTDTITSAGEWKKETAGEKKMYYRIDSGDQPVICELKMCMDLLEAEASDYNEGSNALDEPEWVINLVWLTQEEYENLPDAY